MSLYNNPLQIHTSNVFTLYKRIHALFKLLKHALWLSHKHKHAHGLFAILQCNKSISLLHNASHREKQAPRISATPRRHYGTKVARLEGLLSSRWHPAIHCISSNDSNRWLKSCRGVISYCHGNCHTWVNCLGGTTGKECLLRLCG